VREVRASVGAAPGEIRSAAELAGRTGDHDSPVIGRGGDLAERRQQFVPHRVVHRVLLRGAVERDRDDATGAGDLQRFHVCGRY
jgi:hypothetical protein